MTVRRGRVAICCAIAAAGSLLLAGCGTTRADPQPPPAVDTSSSTPAPDARTVDSRYGLTCEDLVAGVDLGEYAHVPEVAPVLGSHDVALLDYDVRMAGGNLCLWSNGLAADAVGDYPPDYRALVVLIAPAGDVPAGGSVDALYPAAEHTVDGLDDPALQLCDGGFIANECAVTYQSARDLVRVGVGIGSSPAECLQTDARCAQEQRLGLARSIASSIASRLAALTPAAVDSWHASTRTCVGLAGADELAAATGTTAPQVAVGRTWWSDSGIGLWGAGVDECTWKRSAEIGLGGVSVLPGGAAGLEEAVAIPPRASAQRVDVPGADRAYLRTGGDGSTAGLDMAVGDDWVYVELERDDRDGVVLDQPAVRILAVAALVAGRLR